MEGPAGTLQGRASRDLNEPKQEMKAAKGQLGRNVSEQAMEVGAGQLGGYGNGPAGKLQARAGRAGDKGREGDKPLLIMCTSEIKWRRTGGRAGEKRGKRTNPC
jgi:hypothetical protein